MPGYLGVGVPIIRCVKGYDQLMSSRVDDRHVPRCSTHIFIFNQFFYGKHTSDSLIFEVIISFLAALLSSAVFSKGLWGDWR